MQLRIRPRWWWVQRTLPGACLMLLGGCALFPDWHWEKAGASPAEYDYDVKFCKQLIYPGVDGYVTKESVGRMEACMMSRGWRKAPN